MKARFFTLPLALLLFGIAISPAFSQTTKALVISSTTLDQKAKPTTSKAYLKDDKMAVETGDDKQQQMMLFDAEKETFYMINHKKKEYTEMTRQDLEALAAMMQQQMAAMEKQLEMMPESQRAMIREKMGAAFGVGQKPAAYSVDEKGVQVKGWKTDKYIGSADGQKQSEIYIAKFSELGQKPEDFEVMGKFFNLIKEYMQGMSKNMPALSIGFFGEGMPDYDDGVPVKTIMYNAQQEAISTSTVDSIEEESVEEHIFSVPDNYKKKEMKMN